MSIKIYFAVLALHDSVVLRTGNVCILAAAGNTGQRAVKEVVEQFLQEVPQLQEASAHIKSSCTGSVMSECSQRAAHTFKLQVDLAVQNST